MKLISLLLTFQLDENVIRPNGEEQNKKQQQKQNL